MVSFQVHRSVDYIDSRKKQSKVIRTTKLNLKKRLQNLSEHN
ncbi:hypothetical protein [Alkalihalobacterium elongatum]|nr:hypothetical protein [Alkalihalobacterium elongatum]